MEKIIVFILKIILMHFHHEVYFTVKTITLIEYNMMIAFVTIIVIYFDRHSKFLTMIILLIMVMMIEAVYYY